MARGARGCRDCSRCNGSALTTLVKGSVQVTANVFTLGVATALRKKCGVCGHPLTAHTGQVVAVTNQQPSAPIITQTPLPPPPPSSPRWSIQYPSPDRSLVEPRLPETGTNSHEDKDSQNGGGFGVADELRKLAELRDQGVLTEEEFSAQKAKVLEG